jgi:hypothetical protein
MRRINLLPGLLVAAATCPAFAQIMPSASAGAEFGSGIASNGFDTVITAPGEDNEGAVFVYSRLFQTWGQDERINPPDIAGAAFGATVALSPDGKRFVTGRIPTPTATRRELKSYTKLATGEWVLEQTLTHPNPLPGGDNFGVLGVAIAGDLLVVGDVRYNQERGGTFIYRRSTTGWVYEGDVGPGLGLREGDRFGEAVATDGTRVIVGAWGSDRGGSQTNEGKAFIFERTGTSWGVVATLASPGSSAMQERFGRAVAISGSLAVVGADGDAGANSSGAAYVFVRASSGTWSLTKTLEPSDGANDDLFGSAVSVVSGGSSVVLVGAPGEDHSTKTDNGAAYVFTGNGASWTQQKKLHPVRIENGDEFGRAVSINSLPGLLVATVGAPFDDVTFTDQGAAYVYESTDAGLSWSAPLLIVGADPPQILGEVGNGQMLEDSVQVRSITLSDGDTAADQLFVNASTPSALFVDLNAGLNPGGATRILTLRPKPDQFGADAQITLDATDGLAVGSGSFEINVLPVNDRPSVTLLTSQLNHAESSSKAVSLSGFATFSAGPANEGSQVADRYELRVSDPNGVFQSTPVVALSGTFNYILSGKPGRATVGVRVRDSGGTANGGVDLSDEAVVVIDNATTSDPLVLSISISLSSISERAGVASATISRSGPIDDDLSVALNFDGHPEAVAGPETVTLGAGSRSANFEVFAVDDDLINGARTVFITASVDGFAPATVQLDVIDDETVSDQIFDNGFEGL